MLLRQVAYVRPGSVEEAVLALSENDEARVLAGGQTLVNVMKLRVASPRVLVDISGLEELSYVRSGDGGGVDIGAATIYDDLASSSELDDGYRVVREVAGGVGDPQVRNRGTVGGNVCLNDPTSNFPPLMAVLDASFNIVGPDGERSVGVGEFFAGSYGTALRDGELLRSITLPAPRDGAGAAWVPLRAAHLSWSMMTVAAWLRLSGDTIDEARMAVGCVHGSPVRVENLESALRGVSVDDASAIEEATAGLGDDLEPPSDVHASADYRREMASVVARRAIREAAADARS